MEHTIRIHNMVPRTNALGPGTRAAIWLQGCRRCCQGCMSPSSRPMDGGRVVNVYALSAVVLGIQDIEGVTISGGEPFLQAEALCVLLMDLKDKSDLSVIVYTGYTLKELREMQDPWVNQILDDFVDILIDGEYVEKLNDGKSLRGSSNQQVHFLTERYTDCQKLYGQEVRTVEVFLSAGEALFVGIPNKKMLQQWITSMNEVATEFWKQ